MEATKDKHILCVKTPDMIAEFAINWDSNFTEWLDVFKSAMVAMGFSSDHINTWIVDYCYENNLMEK